MVLADRGPIALALVWLLCDAGVTGERPNPVPAVVARLENIREAPSSLYCQCNQIDGRNMFFDLVVENGLDSPATVYAFVWARNDNVNPVERGLWPVSAVDRCLTKTGELSIKDPKCGVRIELPPHGTAKLKGASIVQPIGWFEGKLVSFQALRVEVWSAESQRLFRQELKLDCPQPDEKPQSPVSVSIEAATFGTPPLEASEPRITVASYYFGNYHPGDPRNVKNKGKDWSEWELVKAARPRFPGHQQPNVPLWGYADESDPKVMEQKIDAAADHGIDAFIFDWYYYNDGPFLDRPIDVGFLKARNNSRLKFAFMWANHDWQEIQPYKRGTERQVLYRGVVTPEAFDRICDHIIRSYFRHPCYWRIEGRPYFSFYDLTKLLENFGRVEATRQALDRFRAKAVAAGLPGLHLNAVVWGRAILPGEGTPVDSAQLVKDLGFDSVTSYVWIHHVTLPKLQTDYVEVRDAYFRYWDDADRKFSVPYYPNVTMGWDSSPRTHQDDDYGNFGYPFTNTISGNTPERFKEALAMTRRRLLAKPDGPRILNINCWNEWTEGSYLEPDQRNGMKYLEAVREVFGANPSAR